MESDKGIWRKIISHPLGLSGFIIVSVFLLVAICGNLITPDKTAGANLISLPVSLMKPGSTVLFFHAPAAGQVSGISQWIYGQKDPLHFIPVHAVTEKNDTVILHVLHHGRHKVTEKIPLASLPSGYRLEQRRFLLGTDGFGRDVFSRIVLGSRVSLSVGLVAVLMSLLIGTTLGLMAGYFRGKTDVVISWFINVIWSLPTMLLVVAISFALGKGFWQVFIAIGLSSWVEVARVVRGQVFGIREKEYIQAARILGFGPFRIMFRHILPNLRSSLIVLAVSVFGSAILLESGLSFLGLGLAPPAPSWGMMIRENYPYIMFDNAYLALVPGIVIMLLVMGFNFLGIALRDALDIRLR